MISGGVGRRLGTIITVTVILTGFGIAGVVGGLSIGVGEPEPTIVDVSISDDEIQEGESVTVEVEVMNDGATAGTDSTISVAFPELTDSQAGDYVSIEAKSVSHGYSEIYEPGDRLWDDNADEITAEYVLAEAGSGTDPGEDEWPSGQLRRLIIEATPQETGPFDVFVRSTMTDTSSDPDTVTDPSSSAIVDQQGHPVEKHTVDVVENMDGCFYVWSSDEYGDRNPATIHVGGIETDYSEHKHTDRDDSESCDDVTNDNGVGFDTPGGDFHVTLFDRSDSGYSWGIFEASVSETGETTQDYERGGVYSLSDSLEPHDYGQFYKSGGAAESNIELFNGQQNDGADATVEFYVYPDGESQPSRPTETTTVTNLQAQQTEDLSVTLDLPTEEGTYRIEADIVTDYQITSTEQQTDSIDFGSVTVEEPTAPNIESEDPSDERFHVEKGEITSFTVDKSHRNVPTTDLETTWYVDGDVIGTGGTFDFDTSQYDPDRYNVEAVVSDGIKMTADTRTDWTVTVLEPPTIEAVTVSEQNISVGDQISVSADASSPSGRSASLSYEWKLGDQTYSGHRATVTPRRAGSQDLVLSVEDEYGLGETHTETISVKNIPPELAKDTPLSESTTVPTGHETTFGVDVASRDADPVEVEFTAEDDKATKETTIQGSDRLAFTHEFSEPGRHPVSITVTDSQGETDRVSWTANVGSDPEVRSAIPETSSQTIVSGEEINFDVETIDSDGLDLSHEWFVDDIRSSSGEQFTKTFAESGSYDVSVEVVNELGRETTKEWNVMVDSFRVAPRFEEHSQHTTVDVDGSTNIVEAAISHPDANERPVRVEIDAKLPDGMTASQSANVDEGSSSRYTVRETLAPGASSTVRLGVNINDERLAGTTETIDYELRYYPVDVPDDVQIVDENSTELEFVDPTVETQSNSSAETSGSDDSDGLPGFGASSLLITFGLWLVLVRKLRGRNGNYAS